MKRSKAYRAAVEKIDPNELYAPLQAVRLVKETTATKFDPTVEVSMRLGVDPRKADQMVRGTVNLPHGTGKTARVLVFANGEKAEEARAAGADFVGGDDMIEKVKGGWTDFDAAVATPDLMGKVGTLGKVLGPRGLMPNPKTGTVTMDVAKAVTEIKGGKIEFRVDKHSNLAFPIGKASFTEQALVENYAAALDEILRLKPSAAKGRYLKKATMSSTMGPGVPGRPEPREEPPGGGRGASLDRSPEGPAPRRRALGIPRDSVARGCDPRHTVGVSRHAIVRGSPVSDGESLNLLELDGIKVKLSGLQILDGVTIRVPRGKVTGLIGPNGAGKTTVFNVISGFVKPDEGTVTLRGRRSGTCGRTS